MRNTTAFRNPASQLSRRHVIATTAVVSATLAVRLHAIAQASATPESIPAANDFAGLIDIGGRSLYLECRGSGGPTVILEAGAGNDAQIWDTVALAPGTTGIAVWPGVAAFTRVCAYDRPGTFLDAGLPGRSDPVPMPRTASEIVADLHALLVKANVPGPYVFAGHSFGGLVARLYASTYPDDVVGLVLIDAAHEEYYASIRDVLTPEEWALYAEAPDLPEYPNLERIDTDSSAVEMLEAANASPLRPMPMTVLTHGLPWDWPADFPGEALEAVWLPLQEDLASLAPDARLVVAEESGHYIHLAQPDLVIEAIRQVVDAVRDPHSWATPTATGIYTSGTS